MKDLPFEVTSITDFNGQLQSLMGAMEVKQVSVSEWLGNILQGNEPWRLAPETQMSEAIAKLYYLALEGETGDLDVSALIDTLKEFKKEADQGQVRIGRSDNQYFDMNLVRIGIGDKGHTIGLVDEEPAYLPAYRAKHPLGLIVLPYYVDDSGKIYVNVAIRNEQGALGGQPVVVAGEQTSLTKMVKGGIIQQSGGSVLAACIQDFGTVNCEGIPDFENIKKRTHWITYFDNTNRMGGGFKLSAVVQVIDTDDDLVMKYKSGLWVNYIDFLGYIKNPENKPVVNSLMTACLYLLELYTGK